MTKKGIMLIGHGSRYGYNKKVMELHADRLRAMGFKNVYTGFNEISRPLIEETLIEMADDGIDEITAIPFFIDSDMHTTDVPPKLRLKNGEKYAEIDVSGKRIMMHLGTPFGEDPLLARILHERIKEMDSGNGKTGVMVIGHGSKLPYSKDAIILNAERLTEMGHNVHYAFNEFNDPKIEDVLERMAEKGMDEIIVLPLFISSENHRNGIPEKIRLKGGASEGTFEHKGKKIIVKYALPIGRDPRITDLLAERANTPDIRHR
ncbi:MAG: hypothetical protein FWD92_04950 [Methanomassiliicoccaceae archaeon]|nr:hypothetical protein [Methanomassiliicoccaceae archaeon]